MLLRFNCTSRHGPPDAAGSGCPRARWRSGWAAYRKGVENATGKLRLACRSTGGMGYYLGKIAPG